VHISPSHLCLALTAEVVSHRWLRGVTDTTPQVATELKCPSRCKVEGHIAPMSAVRTEVSVDGVIANRLTRFAAVKSHSRVAGARGAGLEGGGRRRGILR